MNAPFEPTERERLSQELLELHFGCHSDPAALEARLAREPALAALQREVLRTAAALTAAAAPAAAPLTLPAPGPATRPWQLGYWRSPWRRISGVAAAAAVVVSTLGGLYGLACWQRARARADECHLTVSAPQAVPAGTPWSVTVDCLDLDGAPLQTEVRWRITGQDGSELGDGEQAVIGRTVVALPAGFASPKRLEVTARHGGRETQQSLEFVSSAAAPLVHVTTDKPVYQPGEPVFVRVVALDRVTLQPTTAVGALTARVLDPKGAPVFQQHLGPVPAPVPAGTAQMVAAPSVGACVWPVPKDGAGGEYAIEVTSTQGTSPPERLPFVVRRYEPPRLQKELVLARKTYAPGQTGSAQLDVKRLGGGAAQGAAVRGALVLDGDEVWTQDVQLDEQGRARFRFVVPKVVKHGAARFVARITDGGIVETAVEPFVVPTGEVRLAAFPEGGELVAGVENRVYFEAADSLGRPVETTAVVVDERERKVATLITEHQGRGRVVFTPQLGVVYRVRAQGLAAPLELPSVEQQGLALRATSDGVAAGAPLRVRVAGRGDGPWLVGAFCRGVLLGQVALRPEGDGTVDQEVAIELPPVAAGVLRVTVFDRALRPVAERLVRRTAAQQLAIELAPARAKVAPGDAQQITVRTHNERGEPVPAIVGVAVTDGSALELGDEPRVGLLDQALLFADVERLEDLGDWFAGGEHSERNADLLLGTRGWRRFVWQNDAAAHERIAAAGDWAKGQLVREGFAQTPQVASNKAAAEASVASLAQAVWRSERRFEASAGIALLALLVGLALEGLLALRQPLRRPWLTLAGCGSLGVLLIALCWPSVMGTRAPEAALAVDFIGRDGAAAQPVRLGLNVVQDPAEIDFAERRAELFFDERIAQVADLGRVEVLEEVAPGPGRAPAAGAGGGPGFVPGAARPGLVRRFAAFEEAEGPLYYMRDGLTLREYAHKHRTGAQRADQTATICWSPLLVTDGNGEAKLAFDTSDAVTTWHIRADAHGAGRVGQAQATFAAQLPFHVECKLPVEVSAGDRLLLPVAVTLEDGDGAVATIDVTVEGPLALQGLARVEVPLQQGRGRHLAEVRVHDTTGTAKITVVANAGRFKDTIARALTVAPRGFPQARSFAGLVTNQAAARFVVNLPAEALPGSGKLRLSVFPSPLAGMAAGMAGILQEPHGCFEQASSSNYPNVMVLSYLEACGDDIPVVAARARELLPKGYAKITGYECKERGYEWFGGDPGHEALTAYGLLQFHDMAKVHPVDAAMVERTKAWLLARRDGNGSYRRNDRALDSFGRAPQPVTDAYVTYALLHAGTAPQDLAKEIEALAARAATTGDAYELALCACALGLAKDGRAGAARTKLAGLQQESGMLRGSTASITSSGGNDLAVETTAFAILAWLDDAGSAAPVQKAMKWLEQQKSARGTFGATQATICALRALSAFAQKHRAMPAPGTLAVFAGERKLAEQKFAAGQAEPVTFELWSKLPAGEHELRLELQGGGDGGMPWACDLGYHGELPADDPEAKIAVATRLLAGTVEEGRTVGLEVLVQNRSAEGQPMTIAVIGLPAGLDLPTSVLDDQKKAGAFDLWELRGRELALYWRSLAPSVERRVALDLVAAVPGVTTGPSSRAYLYYTPASVRWASPLRIEVAAAK